jgi:GT2 family glycosyltransferase
LQTIQYSSHKDVQVIIVDDSANDPIQLVELEKFNMHIEIIRINRDKKYWSNPCINYNIGFAYVKGGKVIIQNAEVCHVGDVLSYLNRECNDNIYHSFDVKVSRNFETNEIIYQHSYPTISIYEKDIWDTGCTWYQHPIHRNANYHFLCGMTRSAFDKIGGFSYDYSFGSWYDDNDFLLKIKCVGLSIHTVKNEIEYVGGIHLFHGYSHNITDIRAYTESNRNYDLFEKKAHYVERYHAYFEISEHSNVLQAYDEFSRI